MWAKSAEKALSKAQRLGTRLQHSYVGATGHEINETFRDVLDVQELLLGKRIKKGDEVYSQFMTLASSPAPQADVGAGLLAR